MSYIVPPHSCALPDMHVPLLYRQALFIYGVGGTKHDVGYVMLRKLFLT